MTNEEGSLVYHNLHNDEVSIILNNQINNYMFYIFTAKMMQRKDHISINKIFDISKIDKC